jgi:hypothetical protein
VKGSEGGAIAPSHFHPFFNIFEALKQHWIIGVLILLFVFILKLRDIILAIKEIILAFKGFYFWLTKKWADRQIRKKLDDYLTTIDSEFGGVRQQMPVAFLRVPQDITSRLKRAGKEYSIAPKFPERFSIRYKQVREDLDAKILIKTIESNVYVGIKELFPLDVAYAFDFFIAYQVAIRKRDSRMARKIREKLNEVRTLPNLEKIIDWYNVFEKLNIRGCLRGIAIPMLEEIYELHSQNLCEEVRLDCSNFLLYVMHWTITPTRIEIPAFRSDYKHINCRIVPIYERDWRFYSEDAIRSAQSCDCIFFGSSQRHRLKLVEAAIGAKLLAPKFKFGIMRFVVSEEKIIHRFRKERTTYFYTLIGCNREDLEKKNNAALLSKEKDFLDSKNALIFNGDARKDFLDKAILLLESREEICLENTEKGWANFMDVVVKIIRKTEARITDWGFIKEENYIKAIIFLRIRGHEETFIDYLASESKK